jgi:hypothetical protein
MEMVKRSGAIEQDSATATAIDRFGHDRTTWHSRDKSTSKCDINDHLALLPGRSSGGQSVHPRDLFLGG